MRLGFVLCVFLGIFWGIAALIDNPLLLPTPDKILKALLGLLKTEEARRLFFTSIAYSLLRVLLGLLLGAAAGILIALLSYFSSIAHTLFHPLLVVIRATPVASFVLLVWCFTGSRVLPIVIAALMVLPLVADNLLSGLRAADPKLLELASLYRFSKKKQFLLCRLPAALPYLFTALSGAVGFAWKAGIAAEILMTSTPVTSIGKNIYFAKAYMQTEEVFAWTAVVILLSLFIEWIVKYFLRFNRDKAKNEAISAK